MKGDPFDSRAAVENSSLYFVERSKFTRFESPVAAKLAFAIEALRDTLFEVAANSNDVTGSSSFGCTARRSRKEQCPFSEYEIVSLTVGTRSHRLTAMFIYSRRNCF